MTTAMTTKAVASVETIRSRFPALGRRHNGAPVAYFDGPGGTQVPQSVVDAMGDYLLHHNANTHWAYPTSVETDALLEAAREALADFVGGRASEIAFGANMTTLTFHLGRALGRRWSAGDDLVVTELDHHANSDTWRQLAKERGLTVKAVPFRLETGQLDMGALGAAIGPRTRLVAIGAASNALGTINDVRRVADLAHAEGALVFVDAVHYAPHALVDVTALGADFLACSAYKFYGPHIGVLWGRQSLVDELDLPRLEPAPASAPENLETGTQNHEGIVGAAAAVEFLASLAEGADAPRPTGKCAQGAPLPRPAARRAPLVRVAGDRRGVACTVRHRASHGRRPSPSACAASPPTTSPAPSPSGPSSSRTATSTRRPSSRAWATPRTASCAPAVRATRRRTRSTGCSTACVRSRAAPRRGPWRKK